MSAPPLSHNDHFKRFEQLLDEYGAKVKRLAHRFTSNESDAEDLTQEIFLDIFKALPSFRGESSSGTWVYRIALNHCLRFRDKTRKEADHRSAESPPEEASSSASDPARRITQHELSQQVHAAVELLSDHHKSVVVLHELHGFTYSECAQILDLPVGTVKSRLSNAFRVLRGILGGYVLGETAEPSSQIAPITKRSSLKTSGRSS